MAVTNLYNLHIHDDKYKLKICQLYSVTMKISGKTPQTPSLDRYLSTFGEKNRIFLNGWQLICILCKKAFFPCSDFG